MSNKTDDPWRSLAPDPTHLLGRRADGDHPLAIYWVSSSDGAPGLQIRGIDGASVPRSFPKPKGISIQVSDEAGQEQSLSLFLVGQDDRDVFHALCLDVIQFSAGGNQASSATAMVFRRLAHWQSLLSRGRPGELAPHEVRGLIGELWWLEQLSAQMGVQGALASWVAPEDHPQDFALTAGIVEVKARLAGSKPHVSISSLEQLEVGHLPLYLLVVELSPSDAEGSISLNGMAARLVLSAAECGFDAEELAQLALHRRGYAISPSYDALRYVVSGVNAFAVRDGFPRLIRSAIDRRVHQATYTLDLTTVGSFEQDPTTLLAAIQEH